MWGPWPEPSTPLPMTASSSHGALQGHTSINVRVRCLTASNIDPIGATAWDWTSVDEKLIRWMPSMERRHVAMNSIAPSLDAGLAAPATSSKNGVIGTCAASIKCPPNLTRSGSPGLSAASQCSDSSLVALRYFQSKRHSDDVAPANKFHPKRVGTRCRRCDMNGHSR